MSNKKQVNIINLYIGNKIFEYRQSRNYTQQDLADMIKLTQSGIVRMEKGKHGITIQTLLKLCAIFKCKATDLLPPIPEYKTMDADFKW